MGELYAANPPLDEAPGDQAALGVFAVAVEIAGLLRLFRDIEDVGHGELHAEGELHGLDTGLEMAVFLQPFEVHPVEPGEEVRLVALLDARQVRIAQIAHDRFGLHAGDVHVGACVRPRQEGASPIGKLAAGLGPWAHGDEARQILVVGSQAVGQPGAHAWAIGLQGSEGHHQDRAGVLGYVRMTGVNKAEVIDELSDMREDIADHFSALSVALEAEGGNHQAVLGISQGFAVHQGRSLAGVLGDIRLVIEGVDLGGATGHEELDHVFRAGGEVGRLWRQG